MKYIYVVLLTIFALACKSKNVYIPIESVKTEYQDRWLKDSIYLHDSVFMKVKGDTIWLEKYKTLYKEKLVRDSIFIKDSVNIPFPVVEYKETNILTGWQNFQIWCSRIFLLLALGYLGIKKLM